MGYCMEQLDDDFFIPADKITGLKEALYSLSQQKHKMQGGSSNGDRWFYFCNDMCFTLEDPIEDIMEQFRWLPELDQHGNVTGIAFQGEKSGQESLIFNTIAPFVRPGSYIEMLGEDRAKWRYIFDGNKVEWRYLETEESERR